MTKLFVVGREISISEKNKLFSSKVREIEETLTRVEAAYKTKGPLFKFIDEKMLFMT